MTLIRDLLHWVFTHPAHEHIFAYHALRDEKGAIKLFWKCTYILCDAEIEDGEAQADG